MVNLLVSNKYHLLSDNIAFFMSALKSYNDLSRRLHDPLVHLKISVINRVDKNELLLAILGVRFSLRWHDC